MNNMLKTILLMITIAAFISTIVNIIVEAEYFKGV